MMTIDDLKGIVNYIESLGDFVEQSMRDSFARVVITLANTSKPETIDVHLASASWAAVKSGYLHARWEGKARKAKIDLESAMARSSKAFREKAKLTGTKITEGAVEDEINLDPDVVAAKHNYSLCEEIAGIMASAKYSMVKHQENLQEISRNERQSSRLGS